MVPSTPSLPRPPSHGPAGTSCPDPTLPLLGLSWPPPIAAPPGLLGQPFVYATTNNKPPSGRLSACLPAPLDSEDGAWLILKLCPMWTSLSTHHLLHKMRTSRQGPAPPLPGEHLARDPPLNLSCSYDEYSQDTSDLLGRLVTSLCSCDPSH